jgi:hypothetical protein
MSHPNHEELTEFLYDELPPTRHADVAAHVETCDACRATIETWRGVRANLAAWKLPAPSVAAAHRSRRAAGAVRWAAAAAVLLASGFGVARVTQKPAVDVAALRNELLRDIRQEVRQELAAELTTHASRQTKWQEQLEDNLIDVLRGLETRQVENTVSLRKDVETVALHAQEGLMRLAMRGTPSTGDGNPPSQQ